MHPRKILGSLGFAHHSFAIEGRRGGLHGGRDLPVYPEKTLIVECLEIEKRPACDGRSLIEMAYILTPIAKPKMILAH